MIIKCTSFEEMKREITEQDRPIAVFGAGVIGSVTVPEILQRYGLQQRILFYMDNNRAIWGSKVFMKNWEAEVVSPDRLNAAPKNTVILLAVSRYVEIMNQLEQMACTEEMVCFFMPMMCIHNFCNSPSKGEPVLADKPLIPKKIHYMWLGKKELPVSLQKCIDSWKRYCPDYEIIRWDEDNYDVEKHEYMRDAYRAGAYGFVPDYARLDILYHHGGIYMDTDVEVIRSLDPLLYQEAFCGVEKWQVLNFGGCSGAVKGNRMVGEFLEERKGIGFFHPDGSQNRTTCGFYDTNVAIRQGYRLDGTTQNVRGMNIYASDYFQPYDYMSGHNDITEHTYSVHWFNGGWLDEKLKSANEEAAHRFDRIYRTALENAALPECDEKQ